MSQLQMSVREAIRKAEAENTRRAVETAKANAEREAKINAEVDAVVEKLPDAAFQAIRMGAKECPIWITKRAEDFKSTGKVAPIFGWKVSDAKLYEGMLSRLCLGHRVVQRLHTEGFETRVVVVEQSHTDDPMNHYLETWCEVRVILPS